jgi:hypothetical protein
MGMSRRDLDAYDSPQALADKIVIRLASLRSDAGISHPVNVLEPTAGGGAFVNAARLRWPAAKHVVAVDIDPAREAGLREAGATAVAIADILTVPAAAIARADLILGNPPYRQAEEILIHLLGAALGLRDTPAMVAMLLPVGFLGSKGRHAATGLFTRFPLHYLAPIVPRPSFTADGKTDRMEYAIFGWGAALPAIIDAAITWEK